MEEMINDNQKEKRGELTKLLMDKTQKLTGALYRVTDLLSDKEPLKWSLREKAVFLMNNLMSVISSASSFRDRSIVFDEVKEAIGQIERTLDLMSFGTYTTSLNFEILKKEYRNLLLAIEGDKSLIITEPQLLIGEIEKPLLNKLREDNGHKGHEAVIKRTTTNNTNNVHYENSSRSTKIIDFLKTKESGTVKDIASIFNGISEKTVQRDLLALAAAGKLLAKGEKRWRTYSLVK